jgi:hypothetical protein
MQVYFSHSYRDVAINSYFLERFVEDDIPLRADQKTDVWCVAKLERYLGETTGFVSIIPRRPTQEDPGGYSQYIGQELNLARRARVPRLLFVDDAVLKHHRLDFPEDAVPFSPDALDQVDDVHVRAIRMFAKTIEGVSPRPRECRPHEAALVVGEGAALRSASNDVAELLRRESYSVTLISGRRPGRGLDDIRLLENLWRAELCVFVLGDRLSEAHIALALAHAHCIPSIRLQHDTRAKDCTPTLSGVVAWQTTSDMLLELERQLGTYQQGVVQPVELAKLTGTPEALAAFGTMRWRVRDEDVWDLADGPGIVRHIHPEHGFVRDEVDRARRQMSAPLARVVDREASMELCRVLYDGIRRHRFAYEMEQVAGAAGTQGIRPPSKITAHQTATCIDVACLFASLLEAAGQNPLLVVLEGPGFAHALAGYRVRSEPPWENRGLGDLRGAVARGDAELFEATGAVESSAPVGAETERRDKQLDFTDAIAAARRMLARNDSQLKHFVDVRALRATRAE